MQGSYDSSSLVQELRDDLMAGGDRGEKRRLVSLDCFRGLTVAAMVLVTDPGTYGAVYRPLLHAEWYGATATDMIFPSFLVMTGVAMTLSFASRIGRGARRGDLAVHVVRRSVLLFVLGLLVNGFPDYNLHTIRIPGVLQRIAVCYLVGSLIYLWVSRGKSKEDGGDLRRRGLVLAAVTVGLLALYWIVLKTVPVPGFGVGHLDSNGNLGAYIDRAVFGVRHLWPYGTTPGVGVTFDPEGLLSTVPALATLLMGVVAGEWIRSDRPAMRKAMMMAVAGLLLFACGLALSPVMPVIKKIWTPTFALVSGGFAIVVFAVIYFAVDIKRWRRWTGPALVFGTNAMLAFALSNVITTLTDRIHVVGAGGRSTLHAWGYRQLFATWLAPIHASLAYAFFIVLVNFLVLYPLYRRRVFLRF